MRSVRTAALATALLSLLATLACATQVDDLATGQRLARESGRPLLLDFASRY